MYRQVRAKLLLPTPSQKYPSVQKCPSGYRFRSAGHNRKKMYDDNPFTICSAFASLIVLGASAVICTCSGITFIISISILCRLHASSIAALHMTFNFSFLIILYRYFGVNWMCFLFAPTELPLCLYSMFSPKNLFRMSQFSLYLLYSKGLLSSSL